MTTLNQTVAPGIQTRIPGTYVKSSFPSEANAGSVPLGNVVILGESLDGVPCLTTDTDVTDAMRFNYISSTDQAYNGLMGRNGAYACGMFLDPSPKADLNKPSGVNFVRVNKATRATSTLQASAVDIITLTSTNWGYTGNQVCRKIVSGTTIGKKITVMKGGKQIVSTDNIGYANMSIQYIGAGSAAALAVTSSTFVVTVTGASDGLNIDLSNFPTVGDLVAYISQNPSYSCSLTYLSTASTSTLDVVSAVDVKSAAYSVCSNTLAMIDFFNNQTQGIMTAALKAGATYKVPDNDTAYQFMTGGTVSNASFSDWTNVLTWLETQQGSTINYVLPATGDIAVISAVKQHVEAMSQVTVKRNQAMGSGAALADSRATKLTNAKGLNSARCDYFITPVYARDALYGNVVRAFDPFYGSIMAAGIRYANDVTLAANFQPLQIQGVAETYTQQQMEENIYSGCSFVVPEGNQFIVKENVSTYQSTNEILSRPSMLRTCDALDMDMIAQIQLRISTMDRAATAAMIKELENWIGTSLLPAYRDNLGWLTVDPNNGAPAWSNLTFSVKGTLFNVSFRGIIPAPILFAAVQNEFVIVGSTLNQAA